jgi:hypothetical protein
MNISTQSVIIKIVNPMGVVATKYMATKATTTMIVDTRYLIIVLSTF